MIIYNKWELRELKWGSHRMIDTRQLKSISPPQLDAEVIGNQKKQSILGIVHLYTFISRSPANAFADGYYSPFSGVASAPAMISLAPAGFTGIYINVTIPNNGSICVDEYRTSISGIHTNMSSLTQMVTDVTQTVYRFHFPVDLCSDLLTGVRATAVAITDGVSGPSLTVEAPTDTLNRSGM